jgi:uncharacterized protein YqgC (DUF456 family)
VQSVDLITGVVILLGLIGIVLPVLPGLLLIAVALVGWAAVVGGPFAWAVASVGVLVLAAGAVVKYVVAGRHMRSRGVPNRTLVAGGLLGIVGFFVVPVIGLVVGFVLGVYLAELQRVGREQAWPATKHALTAVGLALLIELIAGFTAAGAWVVGATNT